MQLSFQRAALFQFEVIFVSYLLFSRHYFPSLCPFFLAIQRIKNHPTSLRVFNSFYCCCWCLLFSALALVYCTVTHCSLQLQLQYQGTDTKWSPRMSSIRLLLTSYQPFLYSPSNSTRPGSFLDIPGGKYKLNFSSVFVLMLPLEQLLLPPELEV